MRKLIPLILASVALMVPPAKADLLFTGSQAGLCCFDVNLHEVSSTVVQVTATLTDGAQWFVHTGSGQHPGFAFNLDGAPVITISNLSAPWTAANVHIASVTTNGPSLGTFDYFIDNPGHGASAHNPGPLSFDVTLGTGISVDDFIANAAGYNFVADIMDAAGNTGLSGIDSPPPSTIPEPASVILLGAVGFGLMASLRRRLA